MSGKEPGAGVRRLSAAVISLLVGCASAPSRPERIERGDYRAVADHVQALIAHEMRAHDVTGLSIAIVDDQQVVWAHGAGWADQAAKLRATERTVYRMGSISKLLTDTAALQLARQGKLALDEPVRKALPEFSIRSRYGDAPITPRQLMTHHSGLPRDVVKGMWDADVEGYRQMVEQLRTSDAAYPPGLLLSYSNVGVTVLGTAIEAVAGVPFSEHLRRTLLEPLGMTSASFSAGVAATPAMAKAYRSGTLADEPKLRDVPAGGLNASVLDMSKFLMMVFADGQSGGQTILERGAMAEMLRVQNAEIELDVGFRVGLGWMLSTFGSDTIVNAGPVAHHGGATVHFRSQMYALPDHKLGVVVASNSSTAQGVVDTLAKRALTLALEAKRGIRQPAMAGGFRPARTPWSEEALQACVGEYATQAGFVTVVRDGRGLEARVADREIDLIEGEDGRLGLRYALFGVIALSLGDLGRVELQRRMIGGRDVLVARMGEQEMLVGERIERQAEPDKLELTGLYEPDTGVGERRWIDHSRVSMEGGYLLASTRLTDGAGLPIRVPVRVIDDTHAVLLGPLADSGEVVRRRIVDGQTRLDWAGYEFKPKTK